MFEVKKEKNRYPVFVQLNLDGYEKAPQSVHFACANVCLFYLM